MIFIAKVYEARYKDKISFLEKIDAFLHWTPSYVSAFAIHVEEVKLPLNKVILKQGEVSNYIYFIKSGEIEV
jgi:CRP-like cAMP-binding protein